MQLKEKKSSMERDKRKLETELEKQRQTIGKQVFLQVVGNSNTSTTTTTTTAPNTPQMLDLKQKVSEMTIPKFSPKPQEPAESKLAPETHEPKDSTPHRRQWDKSQKSFIDLENDSKQAEVTAPTTQNGFKQRIAPAATKTASPTPSVDLSLAYTSRDEMIRTIEALKSTTIALASKAATVAAEQSRQSGSDSAVKDIDTELQKANSKLSELQNEIQRLSLMQQQQQQQHTLTRKSYTVNIQSVGLTNRALENSPSSTDEFEEHRGK